MDAQQSLCRRRVAGRSEKNNQLRYESVDLLMLRGVECLRISPSLLPCKQQIPSLPIPFGTPHSAVITPQTWRKNTSARMPDIGTNLCNTVRPPARLRSASSSSPTLSTTSSKTPQAPAQLMGVSSSSLLGHVYPLHASGLLSRVKVQVSEVISAALIMVEMV